MQSPKVLKLPLTHFSFIVLSKVSFHFLLESLTFSHPGSRTGAQNLDTLMCRGMSMQSLFTNVSAVIVQTTQISQII